MKSNTKTTPIARALGLAMGLALAPVLAAQGQQAQGQQAQQAQGQQQAQAQTKNVTVTGCVRQASDSPQMFALAVPQQPGARGTSGQAGTQGQAGQAGQAGTQGQAGQAGQAGQSGQPAQTGQTMSARYQLIPPKGEDLEQYVGKRIEVSGQLTRFRDERGADLVIETVRPDSVAITTVDLQVAPRLQAATIRPVAGSCPSTPGGKSPNSAGSSR